MRKLVIPYLFLISSIGIGQTADTVYVPLHNGNQWQYIFMGVDEDGPSYLLTNSVVLADTNIAGIIYYKVDNAFLNYSIPEKKLFVPWNDTPRVFVDFTIPNGNTYQSFSGGTFRTVQSESGSDEIFGVQRPYGGYLYIATTWGIRQHYSDSIGLSYEKIADNMYARYRYLIAALLYDSAGTSYFSDGYTAVFQISPIISVDSSVFNLNFTIDHNLNYILPPGSPPWHHSVDFIDSVIMYSYYSNGDSIIQLNPLIPMHPAIRNYNLTTILDTSLMKSGFDFYYRFKATDKYIIPGISYAPDTGYYRCEWLFPSGIEAAASSPFKFTLAQNYPNPFNPSTKITYSIPVQSKVCLTVYDALGREVRKLVDEDKEAGNYEIKFNTEGLASGMYFYRLNAGEKVISKKMILLK